MNKNNKSLDSFEEAPKSYEKVNVKDLEVRELPKFDPKPYVGTDVVIENVEVRVGNYGFYLYAESVVLETFNNGTKIRASKIYGLQTDVETKPFIAKGSKLDLELQDLKLKTWKDLVGATVKLQLTPITKDGNRYLTW